jgi:lysyl-tRNA synthetase class 2
MLEFYWAYATYHDLMTLTEQLIGELADEVNGTRQVQWDGDAIDLSAPWRRLTVRQAVRELGGIAQADELFADPVLAARVASAHGVPAADIVRSLFEGVDPAAPGPALSLDEAVAAYKDASRRDEIVELLLARFPSEEMRRIRAGHLGFLVFEATAEAKLIQPTFLTEMPLAVSPLARRNDAQPEFCDRFELFIGGKEIANGFSELNDPDDQRARFVAQLQAKAAGSDESMDYDEDYCRALEVGMPPTAGEGIGVDRLVMLLTGQASIRDVILFPLMRPE